MTGFKTSLIVSILLLGWLAVPSPCVAKDTYVGATVDAAGDLRIQRAKGHVIVFKKDSEQTAFDQIAISKGGESVGWLAMYPNCCTSYPIPRKLRLYSHGRLSTFGGDSLPIWRWQFTSDGRRVAFEQETVHGGFGIHYELRDIATGRLTAQYDPPVGSDNRPSSSENVPQWVVEFDKATNRW
jgi:hypothetical protein